MSANGEQDQEDFNYTDEGLGVEHDDGLGADAEAEPDIDGDADAETDMQPESNGKDADGEGAGGEGGNAGVEDPVSFVYHSNRVTGHNKFLVLLPFSLKPRNKNVNIQALMQNSDPPQFCHYNYICQYGILHTNSNPKHDQLAFPGIFMFHKYCLFRPKQRCAPICASRKCSGACVTAPCT